MTKLDRLWSHFDIKTVEDWSQIHPQEILNARGFGQAALDDLRRLICWADVSLLNDQTPEFWQALSEASTQPVVCPFTVVIDTREQHPYSFDTFNSDYKTKDGLYRPFIIPSQRGTLKSGDYSILGFEDKVAVERKSLEDLYGTLGQGRERFERELVRLNEMDFAKVVIEADLKRVVCNPPEHSQMSSVSVHRSILAFEQRYVRVHWCYASTRRFAERETFRALEQWWRQHWKKVKEEQ